jgi:hypothetical protein
MRTKMTRSISAVLLALGALGALGSGLAPAGAQTPPGAEVPASRRPPVRARPRITVAPAYPYRLQSTTYPVPYRYEYPGPGYVRQCSSWLATENRVAGSVIVPRMRCWWQRG